MPKKDKTASQVVKVGIPIEWCIPEGTVAPFASNMTVQIIENAFKICFFQSSPPIKTEQATSPPEKIRADYVGGVIITPDKLAKFIKVLQSQLDRYQMIKDAGDV